MYRDGTIRFIKAGGSRAGVETLKGIRWTEKHNSEFKKERERQLAKNEKERLPRSERRIKSRIREILKNNLNKNDWFLTLTFRDNLQDYGKANKKFNYWATMKNKDRDLKYLCIKELQKRGAIHYHLILFDAYDVFGLAQSWTYGRTHFRPILDRNVDRISNYLTKYFDKEKNQLIHNNKRIFTTSQNLKQTYRVEKYLWDYVMKKHNYDVDVSKYDWLKFNDTYNLAVAYFGKDKVVLEKKIIK